MPVEEDWLHLETCEVLNCIAPTWRTTVNSLSLGNSLSTLEDTRAQQWHITIEDTENCIRSNDLYSFEIQM